MIDATRNVSCCARLALGTRSAYGLPLLHTLGGYFLASLADCCPRLFQESQSAAQLAANTVRPARPVEIRDLAADRPQPRLGGLAQRPRQ